MSRQHNGQLDLSIRSHHLAQASGLQGAAGKHCSQQILQLIAGVQVLSALMHL